MNGKPIKPSDIAKARTRVIPSFVFDAFNDVIARKWTGTGAVVRQDDIIAEIKLRTPEATSIEMWWLDVEDAYRAEGWSVSYDKPGYNESYPATFTFSAKRKP